MRNLKGRQRDSAESLFKVLCSILSDELDYVASVSYLICEEIIIHYSRDLERLHAVHHTYLHPTKHGSYLAFWVRKLKPISNAVPSKIYTEGNRGKILDSEDTEVNEKAAIRCALRSLHHSMTNAEYLLPSGLSAVQFTARFNKTIKSYFSEVTAPEPQSGTRFELLVYDMKFRTFGPHHLTHVLTHLLRETFNGAKKAKAH